MGFFSGDNRSKRKTGWVLLFIFLLVCLAVFVDYPKTWNNLADFLGLPHLSRPFKLGLDLQGGTQLIYEADLSEVKSEDQSDSMEGVKEVIERRVNLFGVAEPVVQINQAGESYRLIVELAGVTDVHQAIEMIGQTPFLDFREEKDQSETDEILKKQEELRKKAEEGAALTKEEQAEFLNDPYFKPTDLTGRYLKKASLNFDSQTYQTEVNLQFNDDGAKIFEDLTAKNIGKRLAIYLDGIPISAPVVQGTIGGGSAQITGQFSIDEAKELVNRLNAGALPAPIKLINQQTIGASLGHDSLNRSLQAGIIGLFAVLIFILLVYRLPGLMADVSLTVYSVLILAIFKLIPVTLTLAGIAGFILSLGMAVDADVLILERFKEAFRSGKSLGGSIDEGVHWAWPAIRDGNLTTILTCVILYIFGSGGVRGFAVTLSLGIMVSMFCSLVITPGLIRLFSGGRLEKIRKIWG